jgi:hypothetical protein
MWKQSSVVIFARWLIVDVALGESPLRRGLYIDFDDLAG